jgi:DNA replication protein DnaC
MDEKSVQCIQNLASPSGEPAGDAMQRNMPAIANQPDGSVKCPACEGTGWRSIATGPDRRVTRCECILQTRGAALLDKANIPARYVACELSNYKTTGMQEAAASAKIAALRFVEQYPIDKTGLLLFGGVGRGKTHLAVGIIKELIARKGIGCLFYAYADLLKQIQNSYNHSVEVTELDVLRPVFETEVLVLDDLGSTQTTAWVWDAVSMILNTRYNENRTTIITTNYPDAPPRGSQRNLDSRSREAANQANAERTLGDQITERMRSRLHEMCRIINISVDVPDYRKKIRANSA